MVCFLQTVSSNRISDPECGVGTCGYGDIVDLDLVGNCHYYVESLCQRIAPSTVVYQSADCLDGFSKDSINFTYKSS